MDGLAMVCCQHRRDERRPHLIRLPHTTHEFEGTRALPALPDDAVQTEERRYPHVRSTVNPDLLAAMRLHGCKERQEIALVRHGKLHVDMHVREPQGLHGTSFVG